MVIFIKNVPGCRVAGTHLSELEVTRLLQDLAVAEEKENQAELDAINPAEWFTDDNAENLLQFAEEWFADGVKDALAETRRACVSSVTVSEGAGVHSQTALKAEA